MIVFTNSTNPNIKIQWITADVYPEEFDFFKAWCGKDPENAKQYYGMYLL